jgi:hypothetical protein
MKSSDPLLLAMGKLKFYAKFCVDGSLNIFLGKGLKAFFCFLQESMTLQKFKNHLFPINIWIQEPRMNKTGKMIPLQNPALTEFPCKRICQDYTIE